MMHITLMNTATRTAIKCRECDGEGYLDAESHDRGNVGPTHARTACAHCNGSGFRRCDCCFPKKRVAAVQLFDGGRTALCASCVKECEEDDRGSDVSFAAPMRAALPPALTDEEAVGAYELAAMLAPRVPRDMARTVPPGAAS